MTISQFRRIALSFPGAVEASHMNHPDFRVGGKIFATLADPKKGIGMVKLTPAQQENFMDEDPVAFTPASGAWGRAGATMVNVKLIGVAMAREALELAWLNITNK